MTCHCSWTRGAVIFAAAATAGGRHPPTLEDVNDEMTVTPVVLMGILPCLLVTYHVYHWYCDLGEGPYSIFRKIEIRWMEGWMTISSEWASTAPVPCSISVIRSR